MTMFSVRVTLKSGDGERIANIEDDGEDTENELSIDTDLSEPFCGDSVRYVSSWACTAWSFANINSTLTLFSSSESDSDSML